MINKLLVLVDNQLKIAASEEWNWLIASFKLNSSASFVPRL